MAIVKRFNKLLDLDEIDVLIDEQDKSRHIIIGDMPDSLPQGRSSFSVEVSPFMRDGVELQIDFIDADGASIYTEPVEGYLEGTARRVSIEIYDDTAPGLATLIIVGELDKIPLDNSVFGDVEPPPPDFKGVYNVRLTKQVLVNPTATNTQPIRFFAEPRIRVTEDVLGTMVRSEVTGSITSSLFDVEGIPTDKDLLFAPFGDLDGEVGGSVIKETNESKAAAPIKIKNVRAFKETKKLKFRKGLRKNSVGKRSGFVSKRNSPPKFPYLLKIGTFAGDETFRFNSKHIGGTVTFQNHDTGNLFLDEQKYPIDTIRSAFNGDHTITFDTNRVEGEANLEPTFYSASIVDLVNSTTAIIDQPFTNKNNQGENIVLPIFAKGEVSFEALPTASYAPANLISYCDVRLSNMRTFSGDVFKVKVYVKPEGGFDDYKLLAELPLEGKELLVDNDSVGQGERTGYPIMQSDIEKYWDVFGGTDGLFEMPTAAAELSASFSNDDLLDSIKISGSLGGDHNIRFQLKDEYSFQLDPKLDFTLSANIKGKKVNNQATLLLYISGSSMNQKDFLFTDTITEESIKEPSVYGKRLGALQIKSEEPEEVDFGLLTHNFSPDISGSGVVQFRVLNGEWSISDISILPSDDTGFSPPFFQFKQELPASIAHKRPDKFEFMCEFYDINNNIADTTVYVSDVLFDGSNLTITGNDNVLESSLFIGGDTIGGGMHLGGVTSTLPETGGAGAEGSGFMRSVGYQGFTSASAQSGSFGFLIFSGSVLPDSGDDYSGVGLELVGASGSFKFRTNPSVFDVRADSFFVGRKHENSSTGIGQFMSGSEGNIEISSSLFHLDPINDRLIIGAGTTIRADLTANTIRTPSEIGGVQSTDLNASSSINSQGLARFVSASIGGWTVDTGSIESAGGSIVLDNAGRQIRVSDGSNDRIHMGQVAPSEFGIKIFGGSGTTDDDILVELGQGGNTIGGFTITSNQISGGELILDKNGSIRSAGFQQNVAGSGFILTAAQGGFLEVENAKIRGTMATTTFEKESVNAVGGQLYVANSTTLTSSAFPTTLSPSGNTSGNYPANETTMSVENVSGFSVGEILTLKKITDTGFSTEYVRVESASFADPASDTDLSGQLYLIRGYSGSNPVGQDSASLGDSPNTATFYSGSQVIVSTGKIGTGFVRINANPNDTSTPYMDIVERTGSAIFDTELKVRLGDLSGVAGTRNVPDGFTGFGLMSEVAFLSGSNIKLEAPTFLLGDLNQNFVSGSNSNIEISSSKFHLQPDGDILVRKVSAEEGTIGGFVIGSTSLTGLTSGNEKFRLELGTGDGLLIDDNPSFGLSLGGDASSDYNADSGTSIPIVMAHDGSAGRTIFRVGNATNFLNFDSSGTFTLQNSGTTTLSGSAVNIQTPKFFLGNEENFVSGSDGNLEIFSKNFHLSASGDIVTRGDLSAVKGTFRDVNVMGALVPNERIQTWTPDYSSRTNLGLVETWAPTGSQGTSPGDKRITGKLHQISSSTWGWTVESADSDRDVVWSDTNDASVLLTPNQSTNFSKMDPPPSLLKAVNQTDGLTLPDSGSRPANQLYDALIYREDEVGDPVLGRAGGIPKIGIDENIWKIRSGVINLPLTQDDVFEINLEFASRDAGNFGGFFNTLSVRILKASDNSILYTESKNHRASVSKWTQWSIPIVSRAGLVVFASGGSSASDPYTIIDEIKIELETTIGNHSGGGGQLDGVILTEMRMRRSPFFSFISTGTLLIDTISKDFLASEITFDSDVQFESDVDAGVINASRVVLTDYLTANGGVHVGGTSDPGTDNLVVDGDASVAGHFTGGGLRGYYFFGESTSFTATRYLDMAHGVQSSSDDAIPLIRAGSITGISTNYSVTSVTENPLVSAFSTVTLHVRINNTSVKTMSLVSNSTGQKNTRTTQAINTSGDTFSAGDKLQVSITIENVTAGGTPSAVEYDDFTCYIEITYDD